MRHFDPYACIRFLFCRVFCPCEDKDCDCKRTKRYPVIRISCGNTSLTFTLKGRVMATVPASGGPFVATIENFVDDKGNPTTESDVPTWASSDESIATVEPDTANPQSATVTLTGTIGQVQITATFPGADQGGSGPTYVVTGMLDVMAGEAVSASMNFSGPGV